MNFKLAFKVLMYAGFFSAFTFAQSQTLSFDNAKFKFGDDPSWKSLEFDDSSWQTKSVVSSWDNQGIGKEKTYAWYRIHFVLPESMRNSSGKSSILKIEMGQIDDVDATYINGKLIGSMGNFPDSKKGYGSNWSAKRIYNIPLNDAALKWGKDNVLAIKVYNSDGDGGMSKSPVIINVPKNIDGLKITMQDNGDEDIIINVKNIFNINLNGELSLNLTNGDNGEPIYSASKKISLKNNSSSSIVVPNKDYSFKILNYTFVEKKNGDKIDGVFIPKYILTPKASASPKLNNPSVFGVRPNSPIIYRIPCTGERPIKLSVKDLPQGVNFDSQNGVLNGKLSKKGEYKLTLVAENSKGKDEKQFIIKVGDVISLTPAMGWNSWNCWGLSVSQDKVMASAQGLIESGLADYGFYYINIDDAWEASKRNEDGTISTNDKFPDMKALGDWLHQRGLKFGIYSSPGDLTCGGYLGSIDHEQQDAQVYNSWGIDYLKYDWCGYSRAHNKEIDKNTVASYVRPYLKMEKFLRDQPRDIHYSLCQYGMAEVWKWGHCVDANSWRTTGDINDSWNSLYSIGFESQLKTSKYAAPGHWNDQDMLVVGNVGWGPSLHPSRLTADEQYTHLTLWTLQASVLLIGCPLDDIDEFTLSLLQNSEVIAVDQDELGVAATQDVADGDIRIWKRPLKDGSYAVGIFNVGNKHLNVDFSKYFKQLGIGEVKNARDLWRQQDVSTANMNYFIPSHGVRYLKIKY
ncbi:MAG: putative Ig domain-containing protein [Bacteroidales bacterium]|nr:putative Ig domain-containing protein [Bacteroidales bacterium]